MSNEAEEMANEEMVSEGPELAGGHYVHFSNEALDWAGEPEYACKIVVVVRGPLGAGHFKTELTPARPTGTPYQPRYQGKSYTVDFQIHDAVPKGNCAYAKGVVPVATSKAFTVERGDKLVTLFVRGESDFYAEVSDY